MTKSLVLRWAVVSHNTLYIVSIQNSFSLPSLSKTKKKIELQNKTGTFPELVIAFTGEFVAKFNNVSGKLMVQESIWNIKISLN